MSKAVSYTISASMEWIEAAKTTRRKVFRGRCLRCNRNVVESFDRTRCRYLVREHVKQAHR